MAGVGDRLALVVEASSAIPIPTTSDAVADGVTFRGSTRGEIVLPDALRRERTGSGRRARHRLPRGARQSNSQPPVPGRGGERSQDRQAGHPAVECRRGRSAPRRETMPFEEILDQEGAKRMLAALLRADRIPGALLFHGPWGVGKTRLALAFARALLCDNGPAGAEVPCNACPACRKGLKLIHPDLRFLFRSREAEESEAEAALRASPRILCRDPVRSLRLDSDRALARLKQHAASRRAPEGIRAARGRSDARAAAERAPQGAGRPPRTCTSHHRPPAGLSSPSSRAASR